MDEQIADVKEEVVPPVETNETQTIPEDVYEEPKKGSAEYNFREMRQIIQQQRNELENLKASLQPEEEPEEQLPDDEIPTVKQVRKMVEREATRKAQEMLEEREYENYERSLRTKYQDFDSVVSEKNVLELVRGDEALHSHLVELHEINPAKANELAYTLIKKSAFYAEKQKKTDQIKATQAKAKENASKPIPGHAIGSSPTPIQQVTSFSKMSDDEKRRIWREMQDFASRR